MRKAYITTLHLVLEILSYVVLAATLAAVFIFIANNGGAEIPTHYNFAGEADGYGSALSLLIMPGTMLIVNVMISLSIHVGSPAKWNMPFKIHYGKEIAVWRCVVLMNVVLMLLLAAFTLASSAALMLGRGDLIVILSVGLCILMVPAIAVPLVMAARRNRW